jgi:hypothetical protein
MKYLLVLAILTYVDNSPAVSVIEFPTMRSCLAEKEALHFWLKAQHIDDKNLRSACLEKARDVEQ